MKLIGWTIIIFPLELITKVLRFFITHGADYSILRNMYTRVNTKVKNIMLTIIKDTIPRMEQDENDRLTCDDLKETYNKLQEYDSSNPYIKFDLGK